MSDASSQNNERPKPHNALRISIISAVILFLPLPAQAAAQEPASSEKDLTKLAIEARDINLEEVEKLEEQLNLDPNNLSIRARLLGYYSSSGFQSERGKSSYKKHAPVGNREQT